MMRHALLPLAALIKRELIRDLRRPRPALVMGGIVAVAIAIIMVNYPEATVSSTFLRMQSMITFSALTATAFMAAVLVLPGYASTAIVVEKESDTYDLMALTLTRPSVILLGKLLSSLGYFMLIVLALLPCIATTLFLVGLDRESIAIAAGFLGLIALTCCSMGLMSSTIARSTPRAITLAYVTVFIALGGYMVPLGIVGMFIEIFDLQTLTFLWSRVLRFAASLSPFGMFGVIAGIGTGFGSAWSIAQMVLGQLTFCCIAFFIAHRMLLRKRHERSFTSMNLPVTAPLVVLASPPPLPTITQTPPPLPVTTQPRNLASYNSLPPWPPVPDGANPMFAREWLQARVAQRMTPLRAIAIIICIIPIMIMIAFITDDPTFRVSKANADTVVHTWWIGLTVLMAFVAPGSCAVAWSREYERETMDLLRTSLLTPRQMIFGKAFAALRACMYALALTVFASLPLFRYPFMSSDAAFQLVTGMITLGVTTFMCIAIGTLMGLGNRRTATCVIYGYIGCMGMLCLPYLINMVIMIVTAFEATQAMMRPWWHVSPLFCYGFRFMPNENIQSDDVIVWSIWMSIFTAFSWLVLLASVGVLNRRHMRDK